jgi:hypothetical protein
MRPSATAGGTVIAVDGGSAWPQLTHNIFSKNHFRTGPHTVITHHNVDQVGNGVDKRVLGSTAPADAPTAEHPGLCLGYTFIK